VVGEGPYEEELKKLAKELEVDESISWEGFVPPSDQEKLLEYYKESDMFMLLSESENYGIVVVEALTMGTPVIITKRTALTEFLDETGCFGVDYPPDPREVADLILKIYESDVQVGPFTSKIQSWEEIVKEYEKQYYELVNPHGSK
jgi:glycosyltransferase involved in cell wall biosynthesis